MLSTNFSVCNLFVFAIFIPKTLNNNVMKLKLFFCILSLCGILSTNTLTANSNFISARAEVAMLGPDIPFTKPTGVEQEPRSIPMLPFSVFLNDNHIIEVDFYEAIDEIEIIISQNGEVVYSSSENIVSPISKSIQLPSDLSGNFLLEIKNSEGAYAFGNFDL